MYNEERYLEEAIRQASRYDGYVDNNAYYLLLKYASISGPMGNSARDAFATARRWDYRPFRGVYDSYRDRGREEAYANMGTPRYW